MRVRCSLVVLFLVSTTLAFGHQSARAPAPAAPAPPVLLFETSPPGAEIYVDEERAGKTSPEGKLKVSNLAPGQHRVRVSLAGHQDYARTVELATGQTTVLAVALEAAKPAAPAPQPPKSSAPPQALQPLSKNDVITLLESGVPTARVEALAKQLGISFEMRPETEVQLREAGATEELLKALRDLATKPPAAPSTPAPAPASATPTQAEVVLWKSIENSTRVEDFRAYLQKYPDGTFSTVALARVEKLEADAKVKETDDKRKSEEAERQAEIRKYTFAVAHLRARLTFSSNPGGFGHLRIAPDGASYEGDDGNASFSKNDVTFIDITTAGGAPWLRLHTSSGNWSFTVIDEADVQNRKFTRHYPPSTLGNAIVQRWGFVATDNGKRLVPPDQRQERGRNR